MKAGEIYNLFFPFNPPIQPGQPQGKTRPALIMSVALNGTAIAVMVKITGTSPTTKFPNRVEIKDFSQAGLDKESYAEVDTYAGFDLSVIQHTYRGELTESDFNNVLTEYLKVKRASLPRST